MDTSFFDFRSIIQLSLKYNKILLIIGFSVAVLSALMSFLIENKYESSVILFPTASNSVSQSILATNNNGKNQDLLQFGQEEEAEQLLQILLSDEIKERVSLKFNLLKHYHINQKNKYKQTELDEIYANNISFKRTEFMSVKISVLDNSPDTACLIANEISALVDTITSNIQKQRSLEALKIVELEKNNLSDHIRLLDDSIKVIRKLGVHDYKTQSEVLTEQYGLALTKGNNEAARILDNKLKILAEYGGIYVALSEMLSHERERFDKLSIKYTEAKVNVESTIPHKFVVNKASISEKKVYPVRWLIVFISTLSTLFLSILVLAYIENADKNIKPIIPQN